MLKDVTRAADELRALAAMIEQRPLGSVSLSLEVALRAAFAIHEILAHIDQPNAGTEAVERGELGSATMLSYESLASFGRCDFDQLREAVYESKSGARNAPPFDSSYSAGHQMIHGINYNSLDRIVTSFVEAALSRTGGGAIGADRGP